MRRRLTDTPSWRNNAAFKKTDYMRQWKDLKSCSDWKFIPATPWKRVHSGEGYHDYDLDGRAYVTNRPYKIAPVAADVSAMAAMGLVDAASLTYVLDKREAEFFVDTDTGIIFGTFPTKGKYTMSVKAVDKDGKSRLVPADAADATKNYTYTFDVEDPPKFVVKVRRPAARLGALVWRVGLAWRERTTSSLTCRDVPHIYVQQ